MTLMKMLFCFNVVSTAFIPSLCGMSVYSKRAFTVTRILFSDIFLLLLIFLIKSDESFT